MQMQIQEPFHHAAMGGYTALHTGVLACACICQSVSMVRRFRVSLSFRDTDL